MPNSSVTAPRLIVGLGNPGLKFQDTFHNLGFDFVEYLASKAGANTWEFQKKFNAELITLPSGTVLLKPQTFMNHSGESVSSYLRWKGWANEQLILCYDDLDITFGEFKLGEKSPHVHNGVNSVRAHAGEGFQSLRLGAAVARHDQFAGEDKVLNKLNSEELQLRSQTLERALVHVVDLNANLLG